MIPRHPRAPVDDGTSRKTFFQSTMPYIGTMGRVLVPFVVYGLDSPPFRFALGSLRSDRRDCPGDAAPVRSPRS